MSARPQKGRTGVSAGQPPRWRWDLNPRWTFTHTRFRVLRTHVQARSHASAACSKRPFAGVTEPPRTTTNETRTETRSAVASPDSGLNVRLCLMRARCASATNPAARGTASVIPPTKTQAAVPDETLARSRVASALAEGHLARAVRCAAAGASRPWTADRCREFKHERHTRWSADRMRQRFLVKCTPGGSRARRRGAKASIACAVWGQR